MATSRLIQRWLTSVQARFFGHKVRCAGTYRLRVKGLEDRRLLSTVYAANVRDLLSDIAYTNKVGGQNTIVLQGIAGVNQFNLTTAVSPAPTEGSTGLPEIAAGNQLTIEGQGALISRSTDFGTSAFRFFDVAAGGSLKLKNLTLTNGEAYGSRVAAEGGAMCNQGTLVLQNVMLTSNSAVGSAAAPGSGAAGQDAAGGAIYSQGGAVTIESGLIENGLAWGGAGTARSAGGPAGNGGNGSGGALYAQGAAVYISGASATVRSCTIVGNQGNSGCTGYTSSCYGGSGPQGTSAAGGGLYTVGPAVSIDASTLAATVNNTDSNHDGFDNISLN